MTYERVIIDKICCQSFIDWTYEENEFTNGREGLNNLHLRSAMRVGKSQQPILFLTSVTLNEVEDENKLKKSLPLSSLTNACGELQIQDDLSEEESILKMASLLSWRGISFCILTGNTLLYQKAIRDGFEAHKLEESSKVFECI